MAAEKKKKSSYRVFVNELLDGSFLTKDIIRRNLKLILLMVALIFIYISNHYAVIMKLSDIDNLEEELSEAKYEALTRSSELMHESRQSSIREQIQAKGLGLEDATMPPYTIAKDVEE
jgi:hypothetical protein